MLEPKRSPNRLGRDYVPEGPTGQSFLTIPSDPPHHPIRGSAAAEPAALSVVVPMFQEEAGALALIEALESFHRRQATEVGRDVEVVIVDDGSTDTTPQRLSEQLSEARPWLSVVTHPTNRGLSAALETGSSAARHPVIAWFDSDLTYKPDVLGTLAAALDHTPGQPQNDIALASCYHPGGGVAGVPAWRLALSKGASTLYRWCTRTGLHTYTSMVRAYRRETLESARPSRGGFLGVTEVLLRALRSGARCCEVPAVLARRRQGQSKMRIVQVAFGHLGLLKDWVLGRLGPKSRPEPE